MARIHKTVPSESSAYPVSIVLHIIRTSKTSYSLAISIQHIVISVTEHSNYLIITSSILTTQFCSNGLTLVDFLRYLKLRAIFTKPYRIINVICLYLNNLFQFDSEFICFRISTPNRPKRMRMFTLRAVAYIVNSLRLYWQAAPAIYVF